MPLDPNNPHREPVRDPYNHQRAFNSWKQHKILKLERDPDYEFSEKNKQLIASCIEDLEHGINTSIRAKKGRRSPYRLITIIGRIKTIAYFADNLYAKNIDELDRREVTKLFSQMRDGTLKQINNTIYTSTSDYVKDFKTFWHWYEKYQFQNGQVVEDITSNLDGRKDEKPPFTYFTIEELKILAFQATFKMRTIMWFMFDSGIRSPTELSNVKRKDLTQHPSGYFELNIRQETSKTFGRRIKLLLSTPYVQEWLRNNTFEPDDYVFNFSYATINKYLQRLAFRIFGDRVTLGRKKICQITLYDFRHSSCCYWLPRYKSESALKYRFGWAKTGMIHYYSELLGMRDTIQEQDLLEPEESTQVQRDLEKERQQNALLQEKLAALQTPEKSTANALMDELFKDSEVQKLIARKIKQLQDAT